ncbi:antitoxin [Allostella vacuolata]|nr:antitoxin [Stella vacuolata]
MRSMQIREAKAQFSALIDAAEHGEPTTITRHGRPAAVVVPVGDAQRLYEGKRPSFAELLLAFPGGAEFERDQTPLRKLDL